MVRPGILRLILAGIVVVVHLTRFTYLGEFAVDCFFMLSGYWIALMFQEKYAQKEKAVGVFYVSRFWRILPVFYVFSLLGLIVHFISGDLISRYNAILSPGLRSIFWISNVSLLTYDLTPFRILGPAWSLDIEMQFYLLFPLFFYLFRRQTTMLRIITGFSFLGAVGIWFFAGGGAMDHTILPYLFLFLTGVLVYQANIRFPKSIQRAGLVLLAACLLLQWIFIYSLHTGRFINSLMTVVILICALPILMGSVRVTSNPRDKIYGEMSYLVYLSHWVWILPYNLAIANLHDKIWRLPYIAGFLAATILSSLAAYYWLDRKSEKQRHRWIKSQPSLGGTPPSKIPHSEEYAYTPYPRTG
jgi:peptidoglycan/LPS O-acetylase OafA/YrhL